MTVTERERRRMELVDGSAHRTDLCEQLAMREYELDNLKDENAKLREERDHWHVEQVHAYGNWEDAYRRAAELEAENAKLRELCKTLYQLADESYVPFGSANRWMDDFAKAICAMREFGIKVGE